MADTKVVNNRTDLGVGTGSDANPWAMAEVWANAIPGRTFLCKDGVYQGANAMIDTEAQSGTDTNGTAEESIILKAENDGQVVVDGEGVRNPLHFVNMDYWKIEGMDFVNGGWAGNADGVAEIVSCNFVEVRRCIAVDGLSDTTPGSLWIPNNSFDILLEDTAGIGHAQKGYNMINAGAGTGGGYGSGGVTIRRAFSLLKSNQSTQPHTGFEIHYFNQNCIWENIIAVYDMDASIPNSYGPLAGSGDNHQTGADTIKLLGSIGMTLQSSVHGSRPVFTTLVDGQDLELRDVVAYVESGAKFATTESINLGNTSVADDQYVVTDLSTISNGGGAVIGGDWTVTDHNNGSGDVNAVENLAHTIYNGASGAEICYQYVNGVKTSNPLWPWPMNARIMTAMTRAGYTAINLTTFIESHFGAIPDQ